MCELCTYEIYDWCTVREDYFSWTVWDEKISLSNEIAAEWADFIIEVILELDFN